MKILEPPRKPSGHNLTSFRSNNPPPGYQGVIDLGDGERRPVRLENNSCEKVKSIICVVVMVAGIIGLSVYAFLKK